MAEVTFKPTGWHQGMTYAEEEKFFKSFYKKINEFSDKEKNKLFFREKNTIAWIPEYDDMMMTWLTPNEIKKFEEEGKTRKEILNIIEDQIIDVAFVENRNRDYYKSGFDFKEYSDKDAYINGTYAKHRVREVMGVLRMKEWHRWRSPYEWGYPDEVAKQRKREEEREANKTVWEKLEDHVIEKGDKVLSDILNGTDENGQKNWIKLGDRLIGKAEKFLLNILNDTDKKTQKETTQNVAAPAEKTASVPAPASNSVQSVLQGSRIGEQSADELMKNGYSVKFDALGRTASSVDPYNKTVTLNSAASKEAAALSLVHAASILRQENSGSILVAENDSSKKEVQALRKADALTAQLVFAEEMRQKNPQILETFLKNGNDPMYFAFKQAMNKTNDQNAARSAAVDCYLKAAVPDNRLGASTISLICKGFDGKGYYVAPDARAKTVSNDLFNEPAFNAVFATKTQQGGR